jgi:hypothetical protein
VNIANIRGGFVVLPHVQAFADAVEEATGADSFGTYAGHDPTPERALDIFVPTTSQELGDAIAAFAIANLDRFGIWYLIYRQRIYNPSIVDHWRDMADRGSLTQNHFDHVHVSFNEAVASNVADDQENLTRGTNVDHLRIYALPNGNGWLTDGICRWRIPGPAEYAILTNPKINIKREDSWAGLHDRLRDVTEL